MAKFHGMVGFGWSVKKPNSPGTYEDEMIEFPYYGDVIRNTRNLDPGEGLNPNISVSNSISIVANPYAVDNFYNIKYVEWLGELWTVTDVEVRAPRLILSIGSVYNGPRACTPA